MWLRQLICAPNVLLLQFLQVFISRLIALNLEPSHHLEARCTALEALRLVHLLVIVTHAWMCVAMPHTHAKAERTDAN